MGALLGLGELELGPPAHDDLAVRDVLGEQGLERQFAGAVIGSNEIRNLSAGSDGSTAKESAMPDIADWKDWQKASWEAERLADWLA